jgi:2-polyprenyl-3-methyl-5-hydroxy-6-metoxy-1,4-benzoquinol methylase
MDEKIREQWESNAEAFSGLISGEGTPHHKKILNPCVERLLGDVRGKQFLDAGCGEGYLSRYYAKKGAIVTAIDLSQRLIETSKQLTEEDVTIDYRVDNVCYIESV